jgi:hypothetical protein
MLRLDRHPPAIKGRLDAPVAVGPIHVRAARLDPGERLRGWMAVRVDGADRDDRDLRPDHVEEGSGRRRPTAVVGDLEQVEPGQAARQQDRIDLLLDVAGQQEALLAERAEQDDRDVVDRRAAIGRGARDGVAVGPQDPQVDRIEPQPVTRGEQLGRSGLQGEIGPERVVGRSRPDHPGLEDPADSVGLDQPGQAAGVVLVRVAQDQDVDPPIPGRDPGVELDDQALGIGSAVDQQPGRLDRPRPGSRLPGLRRGP